MNETPAPPEPGLGDYIAMLWRRLPLIIAVTIAVTVAAGAVLLTQQKQFQATASVVIQPVAANPLTTASPAVNSADATQIIQTEIAVIEGQRVRLLVEKQVGSSAPSASVTQQPNTNVVHIAAEMPHPKDAVKVVNAYVAAYFNIRKQDQLSAIGASVTQVENQLGDANKQLAQIEQLVASQPAELIPAAQARYQGQESTLTQRIQALSGQLDTLKIAAGTATGGVTLAGPVKQPTSPISPSKTKTLGAGLAGGLILGLGLGFLAEYLDGSVKDSRDLARALPTVPILAIVPKPKGKGRGRRRGATVQTLFPEGAAEQAYETAAVAIAAQERDHQLNSVVVAAPEKSASTEAIGLATAMTSTGRTVVLVDASPRGRNLPEKLVPADRGLAGAVDGRSQIVPVASNPRLCVIGSGLEPQKHLPPLPELHEALDRVSKAADVAVLCADPVLTYSDAMVLAGETSGTVLVARTRRTSRLSLQQSLDRLTKVHSDVIGVILVDG